MTVRKLPADIARCSGLIDAGGMQVCPQRDNCLRFLSPPHQQPFRQVWLHIKGADQVGDCTEFANHGSTLGELMN